MDFFEFFEDAFSWVFLVFSFCWGFTGMIKIWDDFGAKLVNTILIVGTVILFILMCSDWLESALGVLLGGLISIIIGSRVSKEATDDWKGVAGIFGIIAFIAMFILWGIR